MTPGVKELVRAGMMLTAAWLDYLKGERMTADDPEDGERMMRQAVRNGIVALAAARELGLHEEPK